MIGSTISHYKIVEKLGEGGMGVVYKAEDTKLERTVALKFLARHLLDDEEAKARFLREAKAAAALHHPNVCPVYEIDEVDGKTFLAMAFLEGEPLEDRIAQGPLAIKDALDTARQVAEGLQAAHAKAIVHRDIKPANIIVSPEGRATIMDFGLARLTEASRLTKVDTAMGTVAYMSPEQAQGMEVDGRTDIWALGCVLYEMVAGLRPFKGEYDQALLYEIVHEVVEPLTSVRAGVPMELEFIVAKCLEKEPASRYQNASEAGVDLRNLQEKMRSGRSTVLKTAGAAPAAAGQTLNPAATLPPDAVVMPKNAKRALQAAAGLFAVAFFGLLAVHFTEAPPAEPERIVTRFSLAPEGLLPGAQISPNGRYILYGARTGAERSLWLRSLNDETARELPGTQGAVGGFWSPDSASLGFAAGGPDYQLKRVLVEGGSAITLCDLPSRTASFGGGTWSPDGERIVFSSGLQLYEVASRGGRPQLLFEDADSGSFRQPQFLPAGNGPPALLYTVGPGLSEARTAVMNLATGERRDLGPGSEAVYSSDGYLIRRPDDQDSLELWASPFARETLELTGDPFPVATAGRGASLSENGTLAYVEPSGRSAMATFVWRNRAGVALETVGQPQAMRQPSLSPDGRRVAVSARSAPPEIWVQDLVRSTTTRLTFGAGAEQTPAWSPSGREIVYCSGNSLLREAADGTGDATVLVEAENTLFMPNWSRDGRYVIYYESTPGTNSDLRYIELEANGSAGEPVTFLSTPAVERRPKLSPDGRFIAYESNESGRPEIYVRSFPDGGGRWQVSVNGGTMPRWRGDGAELYYVERTTVMAVSVSSGQAFAVGQPQRLFEWPDARRLGEASYDVAADGQRFLTLAPAETDGEEEPARIRIVENWHEEFRDREQ